MKKIEKAALATALATLLAACGGNGNVKQDAPEQAAPATAAAEAPADAAAEAAPGEPRVYASAASSTFPDGDPVEPGPKGRTARDIELKTPHVASDDLKERALERWALLMAKRGEEAFAYLTPGYRSNKTAETWARDMSARPITWKDVGVHAVTCEKEDACEVSLWSESEVKLSVAMGTNSVFGGHMEEWLRIDGVWYYLPNH